MAPLNLSRAQSRLIDQQALEQLGLPGLVLMENAGRGCAEVLLARGNLDTGDLGKVVIVCGKGNNGVDGLVIARHLRLHGQDVRVMLLANPADLRGDAAVNWQAVSQLGIPMKILLPAAAAEIDYFLTGANWLVDAILGTGFSGTPAPLITEAIEAINRSPAQVLAVDLPSGLDCDTGLAAGAVVKADVTCTFVGLKQGFAEPTAKRLVGEVRVVPIGLPLDFVERLLADKL